MPLAVAYVQDLDPLGNRFLSTLFAGLPVLVLFYLLVAAPRGSRPRPGPPGPSSPSWSPGSSTACPSGMAVLVVRLRRRLRPAARRLDHLQRHAALQHHRRNRAVHRSSAARIAGLSGDARVQAILIGFCFGAFLEGAAGGGTPVAICGAILVGLGFQPFLAAVLCLIANTSPVGYGGLGTPLIILTASPTCRPRRSASWAGTSCRSCRSSSRCTWSSCMCSWRQTLEVWPALLVAGGSFAVFQYLFATVPRFVARHGRLPHDRHRRRHLLAARPGRVPQVLEAEERVALRQAAGAAAGHGAGRLRPGRPAADAARGRGARRSSSTCTTDRTRR